MTSPVKWIPAAICLSLLPTASSALPAAGDWYVDAAAAHCPAGRGSGTQAAPFCSIQVAVDAASSGDTIHIAPGTYFENLLIDKKDLTIIGTGGREATIPDGMGSGSVVRVRDTAATLTGLTLTNGTGTSYSSYYYADHLWGGGLFAYSPLSTGDLVQVRDCNLTGNSANIGGGAANYATDVLLVGSYVCDNVATARGPGGFVGGAGVAGISSASVGILESSVVENILVSLTVGGSKWHTNSFGGGIVAQELTLTNSSVDDNEIQNPVSEYGQGRGYGGGVAAWTLVAINSSISNNAAAEGGGVYVGGIFRGPGFTLTNCIVAWNHSFNQDPFGDGAGLWQNTGSSVVSNSVFFGNRRHLSEDPRDQYAYSIHNNHDLITVDHSLVEEGWYYYSSWQPGPGLISGDPLFVDPLNGDYRLLPGSPCIDAGDNTVVPLGITTDLRGAPRFLDDPLTPDTGVGAAPVVDMGAFEFFRRFRDARGVPVTPAPPRKVP